MQTREQRKPRKDADNDLYQKMWQSMRVCKRFTIAQLMATAAVRKYTTAMGYVRALLKGGFVRVQRPYTGRPGEGCIYAIARDTGPKRPLVWRGKGVYDQNTGLAWKQGKAFDKYGHEVDSEEYMRKWRESKNGRTT